MLFYNHKHEFIGIDEEGLKLLNYRTMEDLLRVCGDVADLFAKEPGYIHNFKSFGWIDFLLHADSDARSAIVHGNGRIFSCNLSVHNFFLCESGNQNGYIIDMTHVKSISGEELQPITPTPYIQKESREFAPPPPFAPSQPKEYNVSESLPSYQHLTPQKLNEPDTLDVPPIPSAPLDEFHDDYLAKLSLPLNEHELRESEPEPAFESEPPHRIERPMLGDVYYTHAEQGFIDSLKVDKNYRYDPHVAAEELGLPVDLIEEFIGDFIQQAYEFKDELFEALAKNDLLNLKNLSHKLKGVAANLRIEDSFEALSIVNTSNDPTEIEANLKHFYTLIAKLEGKELSSATYEEPVVSSSDDSCKTPQRQSVSEKVPESDDLYTLSFKSDEPVVLETIIPIAHQDESPKEIEVSLKEYVDEPVEVIEPLSPINAPITESHDVHTPLIEETAVESSVKIHYDRGSVAGALGIDRAFLDILIDEYKRDALISARALMAAIGAFDTHGWKHTAAELKGISDNLRLSEISEELAILSKTNDAQEANKASKRLNSYLEQL